MTDPAADSTPSPFSDQLRELFHDRSWVSGPAVSPDGQRIAFVVATTDLDANTTKSRVWLTSPDGDPAPVTAGPNDSQPAWSPDGRFLAFASKRGDKDKEATLHVMPVSGPGEVRTLGSMPEGFTQPTWSPDGKQIAFTSRTRDKRYDAKDESWQPPRQIETLFTRLNGEGWIVDRPIARVRRQFRRHRYPTQSHAGTAPPHAGSPGSRTRRRSSPARPATTDGTSTWPSTSTSSRSMARSAPSPTRPATTRIRPSPPTGRASRCSGRDDPLIDPQNSAVGIVGIGGGEITWISTTLDRNWQPFGSTRSAGLDRRRHAAGDGRGPWRDPPVRAGRRWVASTAGTHQGAARGAGLRRRGRDGGDGPGDRAAPRRTVHAAMGRSPP